MKRAGISAITQNILIAAAYKRAAQEAANHERSSLYETYSVLALDRAGISRKVLVRP
jgi:hypothetical protein